MQSPKRITKRRVTSPLRKRTTSTFTLFEETAEIRQTTLKTHELQRKEHPDSNKENRPTTTTNIKSGSPSRSSRSPTRSHARSPLRSLDTQTHKGYLHDIRRDLVTQL